MKKGFSFGKSKAGMPKPVASPPEKVTIVVYKSQIVQLVLPYDTPRAKEIRDSINFKVLNEDSTRIFYYDSTDSSSST